jgi:hypothetical protein
MESITRKICLVGAPGVGKTSLSARFLTNTFSEQYLSTLGVKVGSRDVEISDVGPVKLIVWDVSGASEFTRFNANYVKGAAGIIYVVDGTRSDTLDVALNLRESLEASMGETPAVLIINKADLTEQWEFTDLAAILAVDGMEVMTASAKSGSGVDQAFLRLAQDLFKPCNSLASG